MNLLIEKDSMLEAIPLGAIGHVISQPSAHPTEAAGIDVAAESLAAARYANTTDILQPRTLLLFRIRNEADLIQSYGQSLINRTLAALYRKIKNSGLRYQFFGQLDSTIFVLELEAPVADEALRTIQDELAAELNGRPDVVVGVCELAEGEARGTANRALSLARYAASPQGMTPERSIERFTIETAFRVLTSWLLQKEPERGLADYLTFQRFGVTSAAIENQAGRLHVELQDLEEAKSRFCNSLELDPNFIPAKVNLADLFYKQGNIEDAWIQVQGLSTEFFTPIAKSIGGSIVRIAEVAAAATKLAENPAAAQEMAEQFSALAEPFATEAQKARIATLKERMRN